MKLGEMLNICLDILSHSRHFMHHVVHQALHVTELIIVVNTVHLVVHILRALSKLLDEVTEDLIFVHVMIESVGLVGIEPTVKRL